MNADKPIWVKPGVRATPEEAEKIVRQRKYDAGQERIRNEKYVGRAKALWSIGKCRPNRITWALDSRKLDGPEVDIACGVQEPIVDEWEAGETYPTWEQLLLLSELTHYPIGYFMTDEPDEEVDLSKSSFYFHASPRLKRAIVTDNEALEYSFKAKAAVGAVVTPEQETK